MFAGMGEVYNDGFGFRFDHILPSFGVGLRYDLDPVEKVRIRVDFGIGEDGLNGFYFTFSEAF
jgi:hypothetical protein